MMNIESKLKVFKMKYILFSFLFLTGTIFAQNDKKSDDILDKLSNNIKGLNSFYMEFSININNPTTGENTNENGSGYVQGEKYFATFGSTVLISNSVKTWTVIKDEKVTYQGDVDENDETLTPKKLMTIWEEGFKSKYSKEMTVIGKKVHEINLYPINPGKVNYHTITVYVDVASNDLVRAIMKTKDGGIMTYTITKFEKNKAVTDSRFVYNPKNYPGYQLIRN